MNIFCDFYSQNISPYWSESPYWINDLLKGNADYIEQRRLINIEQKIIVGLSNGGGFTHYV